jgi:hypothetical protein
MGRNDPYQFTKQERKHLRDRDLLLSRQTADGLMYYLHTGTLKARMAKLLMDHAVVNSMAEFNLSAISKERFGTQLVGLDDEVWTDEGIEWVWRKIRAIGNTNPLSNSSIQHYLRHTSLWVVTDTVNRRVEGEGVVEFECWALTDNVELITSLDITVRNDNLYTAVRRHHERDEKLVGRVPDTLASVLAANMTRLEQEQVAFTQAKRQLTAGMSEEQVRELTAKASEIYNQEKREPDVG